MALKERRDANRICRGQSSGDSRYFPTAQPQQTSKHWKSKLGHQRNSSVSILEFLLRLEELWMPFYGNLRDKQCCLCGFPGTWRYGVGFNVGSCERRSFRQKTYTFFVK
ncbi:hypothetical protein JTB14_011301 [Gonioctena quinquepunctata]|nr:hypothetical protein JTB14_011301 [Gonioctena quinquepunctata]